MKKQVCHLPPAWHGRPAHDGPQAVPVYQHTTRRGIGLRPTIGGTPMPRRNAAFSLMEVLLAVFILGIGLIMVATIFPIGADWTRQSAEDSVAQAVAQNALTIVQNYYAPNSPSFNPSRAFSNITTPTLQALPAFTTTIPVSERSYQFGNATPFPAPNPANCTYYWTALTREQPGQTAGISKRYDLYILVFRKGDKSQLFTPQIFPSGSSATEVTGVRDSPIPLMNYLLEPTLLSATYSTTTPVPPIGFIGIGQQSGTVFRQGTVVDYTVTPPTVTPIARPKVITSENVIYAAPADGTTASPLIYVYQTTVSF